MSKKRKTTSNGQISKIMFFIVFVWIFVMFFVVLGVLASTSSDTEVQFADNGMRFNRMTVDVVWNNDRSCKISQTIDVEFFEESHGIYVDIPVNSGEKIRNLTARITSVYNPSVPYTFEYQAGFNIVRIIVGDPDKLFKRNQTMTCKVEYDYLTPVHPDGENILDINAIGRGWTCAINNVTVNVMFPEVPKNTPEFFVSGNPTDNYAVSNGGKVFTVTADHLDPFNGVRVKGVMPDGVLVGRNDFEGIVTVVVGVLLLGIVILAMIFFGRDKPLTPVVEFYPPYITGLHDRKRRMLPVQMGKIIDNNCSATDVTSLIFYWAGEGYLDIEERDGETYLIKKKELDAVTSYENKLFRKLFAKATPVVRQKENTAVDNAAVIEPFEEYSSSDTPTDALTDTRVDNNCEYEVCVDDLAGTFSSNITEVVNGVNAEYKGKLYSIKHNLLSYAMMLAIIVYGVLTSVFCTLRVATGFYHYFGLAVIMPVVISYGIGSVIVHNYFKISRVLLRVYIVLFVLATLAMSVGIVYIIPTNVMIWPEKVLFALFLGCSSTLAPFLTQRTPFYTEQLNSIIGFRDFIRDVEKDKLELMLKDDPQYYYNILPYANVLGVSKIWKDKFSELAIEPPTYYRSYGGNLFDLYILSRLSDSMGSSLNAAPPKSGGGSFSGGSFGGGGGGFGGFGGGGGGRW